MEQNYVKDSPLGKQNNYNLAYQPTLLFPISRQSQRQEIGIQEKLPFCGYDFWTAYEVSWLNTKGKPQVAIAQFTLPCTTLNLIESKSIKLYLNSFNQSRFDNLDIVKNMMCKDLSHAAGGNVQVELLTLAKASTELTSALPGNNIDHYDIEVDTYQVNPTLLKTENTIISEKLNSNLLKSNCLVTHQPDWGSVYIHYHGPKIQHESLLAYIISYRQKNEFHEPCIERMFMDITRQCHPEQLTVYARYTRRGGLDINPFRSNFEEPPSNLIRLIRQ